MFKLCIGKGIKQFSIIALFSIIAIGCSSTQQQRAPIKIESLELGFVTKDSDTYLVLAKQSTGLVKQARLLQALRASQNENLSSLSKQLLNILRPQKMLSDDHELELQLLQSFAYRQNNESELAISVLQADEKWQLMPSRILSFYQLVAKLNMDQLHHVSSALALLQGYPFSKDEEVLALMRENIWQQLSAADIDTLSAIEFDEYQTQGWQALVMLTKSSMHSPQVLRQKLSQWTIDYQQHMSVNRLPVNLVAAANVTPFTPQKIAVLVPLSGRYKRIGQALQNGILSNLMAHNTEQELLSFDTQELGASHAYQMAIDAGAEFIIGPLLKSEVNEVSTIESNVPTLYLNKLLDSESNPAQFFFSLDKESEAIQGSEFLFRQGKKQPIIVAPNNAQGHKIAKKFSESWQLLNAENTEFYGVEAFFFKNDKELKETIEKLLETKNSQARINYMRLLVGHKMISETRSRRDIDAIYLVANTKQTGMLVPSVRVSISSFAEQIPVYVGSGGNDRLN